MWQKKLIQKWRRLKKRKKEISANSEATIKTEVAILDDFNVPHTFNKFPVNFTVPPLKSVR